MTSTSRRAASSTWTSWRTTPGRPTTSWRRPSGRASARFGDRPAYLLLALVRRHQLLVARAALDQDIVRPTVDDPTVLDVDDLVRERDGGLAVGDHDDG